MSCEYNAPYARGKRRKTAQSGEIRLLTITATQSESHTATLCNSPNLSRCHVTDNNHEDSLLGNLHAEEGRERPLNDSSRASPEPGQSDRQGHFVGASSGLSFLLRLQRRLRKEAGGVPETSVFTLGDAILPEFDEVTFIPPSREDAASLLKTYFELASPTYRFLHRPTIESWTQELYDTGSISGGHFHSKYAVILTVFAQATRYTGAASNTPDANTG